MQSDIANEEQKKDQQAERIEWDASPDEGSEIFVDVEIKKPFTELLMLEDADIL